MGTINLLYKTRYDINEYIHIEIPKVGEILEQEDDYYNLVSMLTSMPIDMMVQLDDIGIDFAAINEYELFLILFPVLKELNTSLIFGDLDLQKFQIAVNEQNQNVVLIDTERDITIDRAIYSQISAALRKIHHLEQNKRKPANGEARKFMLKRARDKLKRNKKKSASQLEALIISLVNTEQYKYDYMGTRELTIYQFNESVRQIRHKIDYDNRMHGVYAGTVNVKELSQEDLTWFLTK